MKKTSLPLSIVIFSMLAFAPIQNAAAAPIKIDYNGVKAACQYPTTAKVRDDAPIRVNLPPYYKFNVGNISQKTWKNPPSKDASWNMWFYAMTWAQSYTNKAVMDRQYKATDKILDQVEDFYKKNPDVGSNYRGWDEGTSLRRLQTLNCLYQLTKDKRLPGLMKKEVSVQFGPRYYGPPRFNIHNHGLMANQAILVSGVLTKNNDWILKSANRMTKESSGAFSRKGMSHEQSAGYQINNYYVWSSAANMINRVLPNSVMGRRIAQNIRQSYEASIHVTEPDGLTTTLGDSDRNTKGIKDKKTNRSFTFIDTETGWGTARFSWTDPKTSYFATKFGPKRWAHGHQERSAITWSADGRKVLVGPGHSTYDPVSPKTPWWIKHYSHNVAILNNKNYIENSTNKLTLFKKQGSILNVSMNDNAYGVTHTRNVKVNDKSKSLHVTDSFGKGALFTQRFHLDYQWKIISKSSNKIVAKHINTNKTLSITTNGKISQISAGSKKYQDGWQNLTLKNKVNNNSIVISNKGRSISTSFIVR